MNISTENKTGGDKFPKCRSSFPPRDSGKRLAGTGRVSRRFAAREKKKETHRNVSKSKIIKFGKKSSRIKHDTVWLLLFILSTTNKLHNMRNIFASSFHSVWIGNNSQVRYMHNDHISHFIMTIRECLRCKCLIRDALSGKFKLHRWHKVELAAS